MSQEARRPDKVIKAGKIRASIWSQRVENRGRTSTRCSIALEKNYRDRDNQWTSSRLHAFPEDLPRLELVIREAFAFCVTGHGREAIRAGAEAWPPHHRAHTAEGGPSRVALSHLDAGRERSGAR